MRTANYLVLLTALTMVVWGCEQEGEETSGEYNDIGNSLDVGEQDDLSQAEELEEQDSASAEDGVGDTGEDLLDESSPPVETVFSPYTADGKVVEYVELERYLGKWYEIATFEILFQTDCTGSTATYGLNDDGTISVTNECFLQTLDGEYKVDTAVAEIVDAESNAKLSVQFPGAPKAPYWIIELDGQDGEGEYEWAVVGSSLPIFLWILSRTPEMPQERLDAIRERLLERGYDLKELSYTVQAI